MNEPARIRILSVDDHALVREGLATVINDQPDMHVVAHAVSPGGLLKVPWLACLYILAVLACLVAPSRNMYAVMPDRHISQSGHRSWKIQDGYFGAAPYSIAQDRDGYLWLGTYYGLYRFDGVRFVRWMPPAGLHLPSSRITSLLADRDGSLWMGTEGGLARWNGGHLDNYLEGEGGISGFAQDPDGAVWFGVFSYNKNESRVLCKIRAGAMTCYGSKDSLTQQITPTAQFVRDDAGYLWTATKTSVIGWKPPSLQVYSADFLKNKSSDATVLGLAVDRGDSLLVGGPFGLYRIWHGRWTPVSAPGFDGRNLHVKCIFKDRHDAFWIGTRDAGLYRLYRGEAEHFSSRDGLSADDVRAILEDREGAIWVATDQGLDNFRDLAVLTLPKPALGLSEIDNVITTRDGTLWIGASGGLLSRSERGPGFRSRGGDLRGKQVATIFEDRHDRMWIGLDNTLNIFAEDSFKPVRMPDGSPTGMIVSMAEDTEGDLWAVSLGPPRHIIRVDADTTRISISSIPGMPGTSKVARDPRGGVWLGLNNGDLSHYYKGELTAYPLHHGPETRIQQLTVLPDGDVLAAAPFGLIQWRSRNVRVLDEQGGLPCTNVNNFVFDLQGNLWLYTECGLAKLAESDFESWQRDPSHKVQPRLFDWMDGVQTTTPPFEAAARTQDGKLWFNNQSALQIVDPARIATNQLPPPVHIEAVMADRISYSPHDGLRLPKLTHDLEIDYTALSFIAPQKVRFRYMLSGVNRDWQDVGARRQAFYMNLKPGAYTFRVIASNNDGVWNKLGDTLRFNIPPAFYQTIWFRSLCVLAAMLGLWGILRLRIRQTVAKVQAQFRERTLERERIAGDLHDTLLQGYLSASLQVHAAFGRLAEDSPAKQPLGRALELIGKASEESRIVLRGIRSSQLGDLELGQALSRVPHELATPADVGFRVRVEGHPRSLRPVLLDDVYRIGREAIVNAFQHAGATNIEVEVEYAANRLRMLVQDNGRGIDAQTLQSGKAGHWGLKGIRERAERIGGKLNLFSNPGAGTQVVLTVAAELAFEPEDIRKRPGWIHRLFRPDSGHSEPAEKEDRDERASSHQNTQR